MISTSVVPKSRLSRRVRILAVGGLLLTVVCAVIYFSVWRLNDQRAAHIESALGVAFPDFCSQFSKTISVVPAVYEPYPLTQGQILVELVKPYFEPVRYFAVSCQPRDPAIVVAIIVDWQSCTMLPPPDTTLEDENVYRHYFGQELPGCS